MPKTNVEISAPLSTAHVVSVSFDSSKGFLVATQKANGNLGRKRALRDRTRSGIAGVRDFILSKYCEKCKLRPVAARVLIGDKTLEYCKPCALAEQAEYERRLARWQEAQAKKAAAAAAAAAASAPAAGSAAAPAVDAAAEMRHIETRYRQLMQCDIGGEIAFDALPAHRAKLLSIGEPGRWNGVDMEFRYITLLSMLAQQPAVSFALDANKLKNRYLNVVAPDHSLVPLYYPPAPGASAGAAPVSAYVNANYCDSLLPSRTGHRRYIATQGPLPDTVGDFWLMCWQENVSVIAMLTLCVEKDKLKCEQYWPEANGEFVDAESLYGIINVRLLQRGGDAQIIERRFLLTNTVEKRSRELVHYLYTEWPDYGCPESADAFLRLVDAVDEANVSASSLLVHCSAGIGRTGTFCAVHSALEKYRSERANPSSQPQQSPRTVRAATDGFAEATGASRRAPPPTPFKSRSPVDVLNASVREQKAAAAAAAAVSVSALAAEGDTAAPPLPLVPPSDRSEAPPTPPAPVAFESRDGTRPGHVSLVRIVAHLRGGRPAMVQTKEQLEFAYAALVTALEREAAVPAPRVGTLRGGAKKVPPLRARTFLDVWRGDAALYVDPSTSHTRAGVAWSRIASAALVLPRNGAPPPTPIVSQGALGDAWFLGALATVATRPELLDGLAYSHETAEFRCRFFKDGAWRTVLVDDRVPCFAESNVPVFACATVPRDNWIALVEKAYAKLHGCYQALEGGTLLQGMVDLTGGAPERIDVAPDGDRDSLWARLIDAEAHRWPLALLRTASTTAPGDAELDAAVQPNRAYPFVRTALRNGERLVVLRDPWFHDEDDKPDAAPVSEPLPRVGDGLLERDALLVAGATDSEASAAAAGGNGGDDCLLVLTLEKLCSVFDRVFLCRTYANGEWDDAVDGEFSCAAGTAGGSPKHASWRSNPRFLVRVPVTCSEVFVVLSQPDSRPWHVDGKIGPVLAATGNASPPSSSSSSSSSSSTLARRDAEASPFAVATAAAFAANVAAGDVPGMPRFSIGLHALRCDAAGNIDVSLGRDATLARTAYSKVREVGLSLVLPPALFVLVPATSRPDSETPFRLAVYGDGVTIEHMPQTAAPRRALDGEWHGATAGGSFMHVSWCDNPQLCFALSERLKVRVTLEQLVSDGEPLVPIGFVLLLGTRRRRVVALPPLTPSVQRDAASPTTVRVLTDAAAAAQAAAAAAAAASAAPSTLAGADADLATTPRAPAQATLGAALAVVGFNAQRSVSVEIDLKPRRLLPADERLGNIVIVPSTYDARVERRFRVSLEAHPAPPKLTPCVAWPTEARVVGRWDEHSAGGGASTPLWRANVQYRIVGVAKPTTARLVLRRIDAATADDNDAPVVSRRYDAGGGAAVHMGMHVLRGTADAPADELVAETELARSGFEAANEVAVVVHLAPLPRSQALYVLPCTHRPDAHSHFALTLFADEPGLALEPADRASRRTLHGQWTAARSGGCANSDGWVRNPHVRIRFRRPDAAAAAAAPAAPATCSVHVLLVPEPDVAARGTGFYCTPRSPAQCTIADILRIADVKFVVGDHVRMLFYNIATSKDLYIVPCTFEPNILGKFTLHVRADAPFDLDEENAELAAQPLLE